MNDPARQLEELHARLQNVPLADEPTLRRRLEGLQRRLKRGQPVDRGLPRLVADIERAAAVVSRRLDLCRTIEYPPELPVSRERPRLLEALGRHQVVIVCGETGSGKTTQLPKLLLELGCGSRGRIGHTQPRRIAARSVATRLAEELGTEAGHGVGWKVRFTDRVQPESRIKLMTDGILLAEIQSDPELLAYDALIIDEAHERSLNIDFLLGYLKRLLPRRPELKLVITSATIDPERFSRHFDGAPIVSVSGRGYPVEIRYRPLAAEDEDSRDRSQLEALVEAADELAAEGPGDILVFLPGEREIREAAEALRKHHPPGTEILPLYARLSAAEQQRVFAPHPGRRIVLATNVAETSLTVPGIRYVIDTGQARVSRYSWRAKVQRLHIEPIPQDAADQRAGRCGRTGPGICIRLYAEEDYLARPRHADPEILRTNLASVILQMAHLGLGDPADFPFIDPPDPRMIRDGWRLLHELGAADPSHRITDIGHRLAGIPLDPRLSRMLLEAERTGALAEVLVIATGLAVQDPRERPHEQRQAADAAHAEWAVPDSDFLGRLKLWQAWQEASHTLSGNQLRKWCRTHFLSWMRMREWTALHRQIRGLLLERGQRENTTPAEADAIHRALLAGLLDHVGQWDERGYYQGVRQRRFSIHPASALARRHPKWIMAGLLLDTGRLRALEVARIQPQWIEQLATHLLRRSYGEPHWNTRRGQVVARERLSLHGLVIHPGRRIDYGRIDPEASRSLFIRHALVQGEWDTRADCIRANRTLIAEVEDLEARTRRRDLLVDEDTLQRFYEERIPPEIHSGPAFERWYRRLEPEQRRALCLSREQLLARDGDPLIRERFPDMLECAGLRLPLSYHFAPGEADDGVTLRLPLALLPRIEPWRPDWLVPGLLEEKLAALLRGLPKALRRNFVPAPEFARACAESLQPEGPLLPAFG
ncbi:MAG: ATP-dependent RNA helicase HrpA, partial [Gammaproteobacteria bacterium]